MNKSERDRLRDSAKHWPEGYQTVSSVNAIRLLDSYERLVEALEDIAKGYGWAEEEVPGEVTMARQALKHLGE